MTFDVLLKLDSAYQLRFALPEPCGNAVLDDSVRLERNNAEISGNNTAKISIVK